MVRMRSVLVRLGYLLVLAIPLVLASGCQSTGGKAAAAEDTAPPTLVLTAGDVIDIKYPSAPTLNNSFKIGPEGTVSLPLIGQVDVTGKSVQQLQDELRKLYEKELQDKDVVVTLSSTSNSVYVTGSVLKPGRIALDRPLTALEAIMETGGVDSEKANLKKVSVIRYDGNTNTVFHLNLEPVMSGGQVLPFYLRPRDIVNVPTKVQWF
jgi:polysaccharide biosynthesis/export protein